VIWITTYEQKAVQTAVQGLKDVFEQYCKLCWRHVDVVRT